jgi:hypothetical protein
MNQIISRIRTPVKRQGAETYLLIILLSFAASVAATRLFLELTGYPQLGGGELHIAHVLWGGVLLFIASLLPLILSNRWAYTVGAVLAGTGVGLFIDEVGKFITQSNDYFYPAAAPIIYAFFLITVLLYLQIRRPPPRQIRTELYQVLDELQEVLDHDLDPQEHNRLRDRLQTIALEAKNIDHVRMASMLLEYLNSHDLYLAPDLPGFWRRCLLGWQAIECQYIRRMPLRAVLIGGLGGLGVVSIIQIAQFAAARFTPEIRVASPAGSYWFMARLFLEAIVALLLLSGAVLLTLRRIVSGLQISYYALLLSLTMVNLLVFYFDQFSTIVPASIQFGLLLCVIYYRRHFTKTET